jgi:hypothetical protein
MKKINLVKLEEKIDNAEDSEELREVAYEILGLLEDMIEEAE